MAYEYKKQYRILEISDDGLIKKIERMHGYYGPEYEDGLYDSEDEAVERIVSEEYSNAIIVTCISKLYVWEDE